MPVYIGKNGEWTFGWVTPMPDTQTTEDRATQLLYSIQFKLSHAIPKSKAETMAAIRTDHKQTIINRDQ